MRIPKPRILLLGVVLTVYLIGAWLLSIITHQAPNTDNHSSNELSFQGSQFLRDQEEWLSGLELPSNLRINWCSRLQFHMSPAKLVALASFPGSGNTWLRYLLQQSTGIITGSEYIDYDLLKSGFDGEDICNGSVLVVKTHRWGPETRKLYSKAILLIRSPMAAIQSEFNRLNAGHTSFASPDRYSDTKGKHWQTFVDEKLIIWKEMNLDWLYNFTGPIHVVFYEQLVDHLQQNLIALLEFVEVPISGRLLACALERKEGIFKRKKRLMDFDPYTTAMKKRLAMEEQKVYEVIYRITSPAKK